MIERREVEAIEFLKNYKLTDLQILTLDTPHQAQVLKFNEDKSSMVSVSMHQSKLSFI